ncbi:hypothetical protein ON010_g549 [Phytophthora cinnamomi]|nr:hypothetical protein ON010_g549 [Phytophthora cinnamomi]
MVNENGILAVMSRRKLKRYMCNGPDIDARSLAQIWLPRDWRPAPELERRAAALFVAKRFDWKDWLDGMQIEALIQRLVKVPDVAPLRSYGPGVLQPAPPVARHGLTPHIARHGLQYPCMYPLSPHRIRQAATVITGDGIGFAIPGSKHHASGTATGACGTAAGVWGPEAPEVQETDHAPRVGAVVSLWKRTVFRGSDCVDGVGGPSSSDTYSSDESIILFDGHLHERVTSLIREDGCNEGCLRGKAAELENFLRSIDHMSSKEKKQSIITALALLTKMDTAARRRGTGERQTYSYYLPLVGCVCRDAWCQVYDVSTASITRYRRQIQAGAFSIQPHRSKMNLNANKIQIRWLVQWFRDFAAILRDVVPVRVHTQQTVSGVVKKRYSAEEYRLLPAFFTWDQLYTEMENYVVENEMDVRTPQPFTFRKLLQKCCPTIRIRSPRSNVCDVCSILYSRMKSGVTAVLTEELGVHTTAAKKMRYDVWDTRIIWFWRG